MMGGTQSEREEKVSLELSEEILQSMEVGMAFKDYKTAGGIYLPKSAVKFERNLMREILSVVEKVQEVEPGKKVLFSDLSAYEVYFLQILLSYEVHMTKVGFRWSHQ